MEINVEAVKQAIGALGTVLTLLKQAKDLLPENAQKQQISQAIDVAERQVKIAESETAHTLGYQLCRNHFPPEIMLSSDDCNWRCPVCESSKYTGITTVKLDFD